VPGGQAQEKFRFGLRLRRLHGHAAVVTRRVEFRLQVFGQEVAPDYGHFLVDPIKSLRRVVPEVLVGVDFKGHGQ
jgi:hypothetical protein